MCSIIFRPINKPRRFLTFFSSLILSQHFYRRPNQTGCYNFEFQKSIGRPKRHGGRQLLLLQSSLVLLIYLEKWRLRLPMINCTGKSVSFNWKCAGDCFSPRWAAVTIRVIAVECYCSYTRLFLFIFCFRCGVLEFVSFFFFSLIYQRLIWYQLH